MRQPRHKSARRGRSGNLETQEQRLQLAFEVMSEASLVHDVVIPLMRTAFERVEFAGGPDEQGKDIICWNTDIWGVPDVSVIQVKRFKLSRRARDTRSFSEIVTQLSQALEAPVPTFDGRTSIPREVQLVSPFAIDTKVLKQRFDAIPILRHIGLKITIVDGVRLAQGYLHRCHAHALDLLGETGVSTAIDDSELTNEVLLKALGLGRTQQIRPFYVERSFVPGSDTTKLYLASTSEAKDRILDISIDEWPGLINATESADAYLGVRLLKGGLAKGRTQFSALARRWKPLSASHAEILRLLEEQAKRRTRLIVECEKERQLLIARDPKLLELQKSTKQLEAEIDRIEKPMREKAKVAVMRGETSFGQATDSDALRRLRGRLAHSQRQFQATFDSHDAPIADLLKTTEAHIRALEVKRGKLSNKLDACISRICLRGIATAQALDAARSNVVKAIAIVSSTSTAAEERRKHLIAIDRILRASDVVLNHPKIAECSGYSSTSRFAKPSLMPNMTLSTSALFDTRLNCILLGEAGAGKTTTLQSFARTRLRARRPGEVVLFVPLVRLVSTWGRRAKLDRYDETVRLEDGIRYYLENQGQRIPSESLAARFEKEGGVLLLDGVDEVVKSAPWITLAIERLASRFPLLQIVASSRLSTPGIRNLGFSQFTILPFTRRQLRQFVEEWFEANPGGAALLRRHLKRHPRMAELATNPLLATILCILRDHGVALPETEVRLYEERLRLLVGLYDVHKGTQRLQSLPSYLTLAAQYLAYVLHHRGTRDETLHELRLIVRERFGTALGESACETLVDELLDPCNILCPMSPDGRLGFGHLRYQEYLAAVEIQQNRGIDVRPLLGQPWWTGVFELLSQMSTTIDWLLEAATFNRHSAEIPVDMLRAIIAVRPEGERERLTDLAFWKFGPS